MIIYVYIYIIYPLYIIVNQDFDIKGNLSLASKIVRIRVAQDFDLSLHKMMQDIS